MAKAPEFRYLKWHAKRCKRARMRMRVLCVVCVLACVLRAHIPPGEPHLPLHALCRAAAPSSRRARVCACMCLLGSHDSDLFVFAAIASAAHRERPPLFDQAYCEVDELHVSLRYN
jgi:hypothetical protein